MEVLESAAFASFAYYPDYLVPSISVVTGSSLELLMWEVRYF